MAKSKKKTGKGKKTTARKMSVEQRNALFDGFIESIEKADRSDEISDLVARCERDLKLTKSLAKKLDKARRDRLAALDDSLAQEVLGQSAWDIDRVVCETRTMSVESILSRIDDGAVDMAPDFQRAYVWPLSRASALIESLILEMPIPGIFVLENDRGEWTIIDGLQRLTAIYEFCRKDKPLRSLGMLTKLSKRKFVELPASIQRRITESQVLVRVVKPTTTSELVYETFRRLNTGGMSLSAMEIRSATHQGSGLQLLKELADSNEFREVTGGSVSAKRQGDLELILRMMSWSLLSPQGYTRAQMNGWLDDALAYLNENVGKRDEIKSEFEKACLMASRIFGESALRRPKAGGGYGNISKALAESVFFPLMQLAGTGVSGDKLVTEEQAELIAKGVAALLAEEQTSEPLNFTESIAHATRDVARVRCRLRTVWNLVSEATGALPEWTFGESNAEPTESNAEPTETDEFDDDEFDEPTVIPDAESMEGGTLTAPVSAAEVKRLIGSLGDSDVIWFGVINGEAEPHPFTLKPSKKGYAVSYLGSSPQDGEFSGPTAIAKFVNAACA